MWYVGVWKLELSSYKGSKRVLNFYCHIHTHTPIHSLTQAITLESASPSSNGLEPEETVSVEQGIEKKEAYVNVDVFIFTMLNINAL